MPPSAGRCGVTPPSGLLVLGPLIAIAAMLIDVQISQAFTDPDILVRTLTYYLIGTSIGVLTQGALGLTLDRRQGRPPLPLTRPALIAIGSLDLISVVSWLYALLTGHTAAVLALGSLAPVLVGGWEMVSGKLPIERGLPGIGLTLLGVCFLMQPAAGVANAIPLGCCVALLIRNLTKAATEVWEREVPLAASYRFVGMRVLAMTGLGVPCALGVLAIHGEIPAAASVLGTVPSGVVLLQVLSHALWFSVNAARVQVKQHVNSITLPTAAFSTPAAGAALLASVLNLALSGSFPKASFSIPLLIGALFLVAGAAWFAIVRARTRAEASAPYTPSTT